MKSFALVRSVCSSLQPTISAEPVHSSFSDRNVSHRIKSAGLAILLLLLMLDSQSTLAQQPMQPLQAYPPSDAYGGQYPPQYPPGQGSNDEQPPYTQPQYGQAQSEPQQPYPDTNLQYNQQDFGQAPAQALNTEQLEQLVAPIALYPDTLVAQVLAAATYPAQVVDADHWRQAQGYASADEIAAGANAQSWDPSLKALTAFPQLLAEMDQNLRWTIALGNAYYNQPQDVLDVVQVMRQRAQAAGNLQSTPQESVNYDQGYIEVAPVNPEVVYLPAYDPWAVYGQPIQPYRGFSLVGALGSFFGSPLGSRFGSGAVRFGLGIAMSAFSHTSFGWLGWGLDWLAHSLLFHNSNYYSHSTTVADWGLPHGGPRVQFQHGSMNARLPGSSYRPQGGYARSGEIANSYRPNGGYNGSYGREYARPMDRYAENRPAQSPYRGYSAPGTTYARPPMEAYNRAQSQFNRPQPYNRSASSYGAGYSRAPVTGYASRPGAYTTPPLAYHSADPGFQSRSSFNERSSKSLGGGYEGYAGKESKSGGFHPFGGGHEPKRSFKSEPKFSRHSEGGGHSGGHGGGKHRR